MKILSKNPLLVGTTVLALALGAYGCDQFLTDASTPQGTLDESTLANKDGVEGSLIGAYRALDCTNAVGVPQVRFFAAIRMLPNDSYQQPARL